MVTGFQTAQNDMGPTEGNFRLNPQVNIIELLSLIINNLLLIVGHVELEEKSLQFQCNGPLSSAFRQTGCVF